MIAAVMSCGPNRARRDAIRRTWGMEDIPVTFFAGVKTDDCELTASPDTYEACSLKQAEMIWKLKDNDFVFFCDDDTYVVVDRLLASGYENHDYMGCPGLIDKGDRKILMAHGGSGFVLSRAAMQKVTPATISTSDVLETIYSDQAVGRLMDSFGIKLHPDHRFNPGKYANNVGFCNLLPNDSNKYITTHYATPEVMDLLDHHFRNGGPVPVNVYEMNFGQRVLFFERDGWYFQIGEKVFGRFELAHDAEEAAINHLRIG